MLEDDDGEEESTNLAVQYANMVALSLLISFVKRCSTLLPAKFPSNIKSGQTPKL